jgi:hypothetical protein
MCPICLSTIGLVVAGAVSTGGSTALAAKLLRNPRKTVAGALESRTNSAERKNKNVDEHDTPENRFAK